MRPDGEFGSYGLFGFVNELMTFPPTLVLSNKIGGMSIWMFSSRKSCVDGYTLPMNMSLMSRIRKSARSACKSAFTTLKAEPSINLNSSY